MKFVAFLLESFGGQSPLQWSRGVFVNRRSPRAGGWTTPIGRRIVLKQSGHRWVGLMKRNVWMFPKNRGTPKWMVYNGKPKN